MNWLIRDPADFGAVLRAARKRRGLRLEDVALGAGVGIRFVSELERGKPTARLGASLRVVAALGLTIDVDDAHEPSDT